MERAYFVNRLATLVNALRQRCFFKASDNVAEDETSCLYQWSRSIIAASRYLARGNAILGHVGIIQRPGDESTTSFSLSLSLSLAVNLVESTLLPRDALPAETASYARKRSGTTACLASIRSGRFAHRVFLWRRPTAGPHRNRDSSAR